MDLFISGNMTGFSTLMIEMLPSRLLIWLFKLHLLWVGLLVQESKQMPEESE